MKKFLTLFIMSSFWNVIAWNVIAAAEAKPFHFQLQQLFETSGLPRLEDAKIDWTCFYKSDMSDPNSGLEIMEPFGFGLQSGRFVVTSFVNKTPILLDEKAGSLFADSQDGFFLAIRAYDSLQGRRLILERSSAEPQIQRDNDKSRVSGFTPNLYLLCEEREQVEAHLTHGYTFGE